MQTMLCAIPIKQDFSSRNFISLCSSQPRKPSSRFYFPLLFCTNVMVDLHETYSFMSVCHSKVQIFMINIPDILASPLPDALIECACLHQGISRLRKFLVGDAWASSGSKDFWSPLRDCKVRGENCWPNTGYACLELLQLKQAA